MEDFADVNAMLGFPPYAKGISPIEKLLNDFEAHEAMEDRALEVYKKTLAHVPSPVSRFLLQLIISDEEKHRAVIHAMAATLKGSLTWTKPAAALGEMADLGELNGQLRQVTDELIELEKTGIREYRALGKESRGYYHGLFKVLLDGMIIDSEKHVQLLEFLKKSLERA